MPSSSDVVRSSTPSVIGAEQPRHDNALADAPVVTGGASVSRMPMSTAVWDSSTKRTVLLILLVTAVFAVWLSRNVISWMVIAGIISYLLSPIVDLAARIRIPRTIATIIVFMLVLVTLVLLPILLAPILIEQLRQLSAFDVSGTAISLFDWFTHSLRNVPDKVTLLGFEVASGEMFKQLETNLTQFTFVPTVTEALGYIQQLISTATGIVSSTAIFSVAVVGSIVQALLATIVTFFLSLYLTKDLPLIRAYVENLFPPSYQPELRQVFQRMGAIWASFFRGQIVLCITVGTVTWLALRLVGMPGALILGILAGMLEIIPNVGPTLSMIPAIIVALIQGSTALDVYGISNLGFALIIVAIYFVIQQLENSILVPRVIGNSVNLHPVVVICGVAVGLNVAGILGAFLAAPVLASLRVLGSYIHAKLLDYPPFLGQEPKQSRPGRVYRKKVSGDQLASPAPHSSAALTGPAPATRQAEIPQTMTISNAPSEVTQGANNGATADPLSAAAPQQAQ